MADEKVKIYVVAFAPSENSPNGVGGFDWYYSRDAALTDLKKHIEDEGYDYTLFEAYVPYDLCGKEPDAGLVEKYLEDHYTSQMLI